MNATGGPEEGFREAVRAAAEGLGVTLEEVPLTYPPHPGLGDLATPVCFELAKRLRKPPRAIAEALVAGVGRPPGIARVEVAGAGYVNVTFDRTALLRGWIADRPAPPETGGPKVIVEHTNINPNKAAHIGHLRNAVLGDTLVRCLRRLGHHVEVQNYIDDTGVQVADLVVGLGHLRGQGLAEVRTAYDEAALAARGERFDYLAWDLYAEVTRWFEEDAGRRSHRQRVLHAMETGEGEEAALAALVARRMVRHHLRTMHRIGVRYDLLPRESDILRLRFWEDAFARLKAAGAVHLVDTGKNAGCWVMNLPDVEAGAGEDQKVIVRSDGTVTYVGKDIAYQMWKLGLLGRDFRYTPFPWDPEPALYPLWSTTADEGAPSHPAFGGAGRVYNVIDTRQSYLQRVVTLGLQRLGHAREAEASVHFAYEMVALTPAAVLALFPDHRLSDEERARPYLEMSGRKGLGVRADDLLDALLRRAGEEVRQRNAEAADTVVTGTAQKIAVGALRYYMLRFSRNRVVAFDLDDALSFEGETGPYLQYSVVRARNILGKVAERHGAAAVERDFLAGARLEALPDEDAAEHWIVPSLLARVDGVLRQAVSALELASVAKHAYVLAQAFNSFYHRWPVTQEEDAEVRRARTAIVHLYLEGMTRLLELMGVEVPDRM
ncbi:MAG TPA: arginine--tRNA ligase [Candidatus Polarisedimenticolaceae bacterium]|nr:arginine--tRNA ligase [Candidatus Polarisedimenticolaceae bacterium]